MSIRTAMHRALQRVITESGWARTATTAMGQPQVVVNAWSRAIREGLVRRLTTEERDQLLAQKRAVRTVLIAMAAGAAADETLSTYWTDKAGRPSYADIADKLGDVRADIEELLKDEALYTLTEAGAARLEYEQGLREGTVAA